MWLSTVIVDKIWNRRYTILSSLVDFATVMSKYIVLSADCQNVLTVEYCVPEGVLCMAVSRA